MKKKNTTSQCEFFFFNRAEEVGAKEVVVQGAKRRGRCVWPARRPLLHFGAWVAGGGRGEVVVVVVRWWRWWWCGGGGVVVWLCVSLFAEDKK